MFSNWPAKPERACLVSCCEKVASVFITAVMRFADIDGWSFSFDHLFKISGRHLLIQSL